MSGLQALDCQGRLDGINSNSHERVFMFTVRSKLGPHVEWARTDAFSGGKSMPGIATSVRSRFGLGNSAVPN